MNAFVRVVARSASVAGCAFVLASIAVVWRGPTNFILVASVMTTAAFLAVGFVGAAIVTRNRRNIVGWIFVLAGVALPLGTLAGVLASAGILFHNPHIPDPALLDTLAGPGEITGVELVGTFGILLFPYGVLGSRRRRILAWACGIDLLALLVMALFEPMSLDFPTVRNPIGIPGPVGQAINGLILSILVLGPLMSLTAWALLRRARQAPTAELRGALTLAAIAGFGCAAAFFACLVAGFTGGDTNQISVLENLGVLAIAVAAWIGITRYGLFDLRTVVNRTIVYGALTVVVVAVYLGASLLLELFIGGAMPRVVATAVAALSVLPVHEVMRRRANRLVYGLRDEPATALHRLGARLDAAAAPEDVLPAAARTVGEALRLRYVGIDVGADTLASWGRRVDGPVRDLALPFAGETIGRLVLQSIDPADRFSHADNELLDTLARQVAVAARAVALTQALRVSHQRLVSAQAEERRRLRRDLHDGLGPTLAGIALGIDTARRALPPGISDDLLTRLRHETEQAVVDVRQIVYDLRPPILDELGLVEAIREQAARLGSASVHAPSDLPLLPAAVEVAAYRIAVEALANAARHAPNALVTVQMSVNGRLEVSITDDGGGLPAGFRAGVGITSMRERATEVGGDCVVAPRLPRGTSVYAHLPLTVTV